MINDRPDFSSERTPTQRQDSNFKKTTFGQKVISGHKSQSGLDALTILTDRQLLRRFDFDMGIAHCCKPICNVK
jgi:hypothetical protein